jgi:hypothetical protein
MENKKYLDKVLEHMVKKTKIDYGEEEVLTPFARPLHFSLNPHSFLYLKPFLNISYTKNHFGLTDDEIRYIFKQYKENINYKIENER